MKVVIRVFVVLTLLTGFVYPALVTALSSMLFPRQANGSLVTNREGRVIGSELIAQEFKTDRYFWPRPSAIGFNPLPSGGTNLGPTSKALKDKWDERRKAGFSDDMNASSASGLDPHISPLSALSQIGRIAKARQLSEAKLKDLVNGAIEERDLGFLGQPRVNVLRLNLALDGATL